MPKNNPNLVTIACDFGSTGSRAYLIQYGPDGMAYKTLYDHKLNFPLDMIPTENVAQFSQNLFAGLSEAIAATGVFPEYIPATLGGTAGMRELSLSDQNARYDIVKQTLSAMTNVTNIDCKTISGVQEGIYRFEAVNYLSNTTDVGTVDWGGGSLQIAYNTNQTTEPNVYSGYLRQTPVSVFVISQPVGNDASRNQMSSNPNCFPKGMPLYYSPQISESCAQTGQMYFTSPALHPITASGTVESSSSSLALLGTYPPSYCNLVDGQSSCSWTSVPFNVSAFQAGTEANCQSQWTESMGTYGGTYCAAGSNGLEIYNAGSLGNIASELLVVDKLVYKGVKVSPAWTIGAGLEVWGLANISAVQNGLTATPTFAPTPLPPTASSNHCDGWGNSNFVMAGLVGGGVVAGMALLLLLQNRKLIANKVSDFYAGMFAREAAATSSTPVTNPLPDASANSLA